MLERLYAYRGQKVGIVTDAFMAKSGVLDRVQNYLTDCDVLVFDEAIPEPPVDTVSKIARLLADFCPDAVIALGGGSPIDSAKAILAIVRETMPGRRIPSIAIPTTSGTGSEVTSFAVISDPAKGRKFPLISEDLVSDVALLDPEFVRTAPPKVTADTGMGVITHVVEAVVSTEASHFTDAFAEKSLALAFENLPKAYDDGNNLAARDAMHQASCLAGLAFSAAGLGVNHVLAHALDARLHLVHGRINAVLMPYVIDWNAKIPEAAEGYARIAQRVGLDTPSTRAGIRAIEAFNTHFAIPSTLRGLGVDMEEFGRIRSEIVATALADACTASNPRKPSQPELESLLTRVGG